MPLRFKCPNCGRVQTLSHGEIGHPILCVACGSRFQFEQAVNIEVSYKMIEVPVPPAVDPPVAAVRPVLPDPPPARLLEQDGGDAPDSATPSRRGRLPIILIACILLFTAVALVVQFCPGTLARLEGLVRNPPWAAKQPNDGPVYHPSVLARTPATPAKPSAAHRPALALADTVMPGTPPRPPAIAFATGETASRHSAPPSTAAPAPSRPTPAVTPATPAPAPVTKVTATEPGLTPFERIARPASLPSTAPVTAFHPRRPQVAAPDLDDRIGQSIARGVEFLLGQCSKGQLRLYSGTSGQTAGEDALVVYALLQAGEATHDLRLGPNSPLVDQMLNALKSLDMNRDHTVYSRSLRAAALSVYHRPQDKLALRADANWLLHADFDGAFTYEAAPYGTAGNFRNRFAGHGWDNSNSQYGALGVWAASEAGVEVPAAFWNRVQQHWLRFQMKDGEWSYAGYSESGEHSMTVAGITTLLVTQDKLDARAVVATVGHTPFTPAIRRGLEWLEAGDNSVTLLPGWRTYDLFGLERAALASGFKYFGDHDWYRELAGEQLRQQQPNGSWTGYDSTIDTAYTLLFLSRGRHPIFMNKLRFEAFWANRPRDIANLSHFASAELERPLNWQVVSLRSDWSDWMDSPVLYIASHEAVPLSQEDVDKLRNYALAGGLIFTHADGDSPAFNQFVATLGQRMFPEYTLKNLAATDPIYSTLYKIKSTIPLQGIRNGARLLLVHSPTDLNKAWQQQDSMRWPEQFKLGVNIFIYAAGKANLRNKLKTPCIGESTVTPVRQLTIAQLRYPGNCDPEPMAIGRFSRMLQNETGVRVEPRPIDPENLDPATMPIAHLTGTEAIHFTPTQLKNIHHYVARGGTLLIDPCGGAPRFMDSILVDFLPHAFPDQSPRDMDPSNPILAGTGEGMTPASLRLRPGQSDLTGRTTAPIEFFTEGKGRVLLSQVDITTGLLGTDTWPINGYTPDSAYDLLRNIVLDRTADYFMK